MARWAASALTPQVTVPPEGFGGRCGQRESRKLPVLQGPGDGPEPVTVTLGSDQWVTWVTSGQKGGRHRGWGCTCPSLCVTPSAEAAGSPVCIRYLESRRKQTLSRGPVRSVPLVCLEFSLHRPLCHLFSSALISGLAHLPLPPLAQRSV